MKTQFFSMMDKVRKIISVDQYDSVVMPLSALRYAYIHQAKLVCIYRYHGKSCQMIGQEKW